MAFITYLLSFIAFVLLSIPTLHLLANATNNHVFTFLARSIASVFALIVCATYGAIASTVLRIAGYGGLGQWTTARAYKFTMWYLMGVTFEIRDPKGYLGRTRPAVFVGNHQT